jgi:hypothetical protein
MVVFEMFYVSRLEIANGMVAHRIAIREITDGASHFHAAATGIV